MFVILFGLSMDYHVFILSRIREAYDRGLTTEDAVAHGIKTTAGVVSSAALVMVGVFSIFATLPILDMKEMGIGLAAAVLIDATIVRAVLLPATMKLLGDWNWYLPRWLDWLPRLEHARGAEASPVPALRPPEGQVARRVTRRVHDLQRPHRIAFVEQLVDGTRGVTRAVEPEAELERDQLDRLARDDRYRLRATFSGDDVRLPAMGVHRRAAGALERGKAAEVRTVCVGDRDPLDVARRPSEALQRIEDEARVALEERVDERELAAGLEQEGVDMPALAVAEAVDAGGQLLHAVTVVAGLGAAADTATRFQGANGFATPSSDGASSGQWRRSTVRMVFDSTQSIPALV
jgi:hypothetical protein